MDTPLIEKQLGNGNLLVVQTAGAFGTVYAAMSQPPPAENVQGPRRSKVHDAIDALELELANQKPGQGPHTDPGAPPAGFETPPPQGTEPDQPSENNPPA